MTGKIQEVLSDKGKRTAFDLIAGTVFYDAVAFPLSLIVHCFFDFKTAAFGLGLFLGMTVAVFMIIHMYSVLEKAVLCDKKHAKRKTKLGALVRMLVMAAALAVAALFPEILSLVGVFLGIFGLKIAALSQPLIDRFISKFVKKEE